jgi:hypothetical protein
MNDWQSLSDPAVANFIREHEDDDVATLALKKPPAANWPWPLVLDQIKARKKARDKIPSWCEAGGVILPPPPLIEQASSDATANYKASLVAGDLCADLTAGVGVDFLALLKKFKRGIGIEKDETAAQLLSHNLTALGQRSFEIKNGDAAALVDDLPECDFIYVDPQRRDQNKKGLFRFADNSPDMAALMPKLRAKAKTVMIKASPVLDIAQGITELGGASAVYVVEWQGACREVLYIVGEKTHIADTTPITPVALNNNGRPESTLTFSRAEEQAAADPIAAPGLWLFEPSPAFMKAGCFKTLAVRFGLSRLHPQTHLYTGPANRSDFPGRVFQIEGVHPGTGKDLPVSRANLTVRNFPISAEDLRKKLKLADGGDDYLFACTLAGEKRVIIHARKAAKQGKVALACVGRPA